MVADGLVGRGAGSYADGKLAGVFVVLVFCYRISGTNRTLKTINHHTNELAAANSISGIALVGTEIVELTGFSGDQPTAPAGRVRPGKFRKAQVGVNP
jgi:hypothetical protein